MRRSPIRPVSKKRARQNRAEAKLKAELIARRGAYCEYAQLVPEVECRGPLDKDEVAGRGRGGDPLDPANCRLTCRAHHDWKHANPAAATERGLTTSAPSPQLRYGE